MLSNLYKQGERLFQLVTYFENVLQKYESNKTDVTCIPEYKQSLKLHAIFKKDLGRVQSYINDCKWTKPQLTLFNPQEIPLPSLIPIGELVAMDMVAWEINLPPPQIEAFLRGERASLNGPIPAVDWPDAGDEIIHVGMLDAKNCETVEELEAALNKVQDDPIICVFRRKVCRSYIVYAVSTSVDMVTNYKLLHTATASHV